MRLETVRTALEQQLRFPSTTHHVGSGNSGRFFPEILAASAAP
jgi:hypothetical protein